ncbi:hypothetical protein A3D88_01375 [Candidatus Peribacteria bacterium RIFCSPHIGHO2_02_FULL_52_16]|nr:MAG: hypothetical protein A2706_03615 [Candidatus Peribacteria bacterium RIFCSPHIGHO2_01_FULL_51_35]OGJ60970.1 MAG: hypothetical protein A3D88_01375 [Candidatus Peribacteria bacterium RIFCSPHIGHO2_02_FULL_52_16]
MVLTPYQVVAPIFSLVAIFYAWNLVARQKKTIWEAFFWTLFWGLVCVIALYPSILSYLSAVTGIADQENAVLVTFLGILFFIVFYLVIRLEELEQRHTKIVRALALREAGLEKGEQKN